MKRDMRCQMALQNKMRALKEQEQSKYRTPTTTPTAINSRAPQTANGSHSTDPKDDSGRGTPVTMEAVKEEGWSDFGSASRSQGGGESSDGDVPPSSDAQESGPLPSQATSGGNEDDKKTEEAAGHLSPGRASSNSAPISASAVQHQPGSDEFWNADVVDEQLFEFLMS